MAVGRLVSLKGHFRRSARGRHRGHRHTARLLHRLNPHRMRQRPTVPFLIVTLILACATVVAQQPEPPAEPAPPAAVPAPAPAAEAQAPAAVPGQPEELPSGPAAAPAMPAPRRLFTPNSHQAWVAAANPLAVDAGLEILGKGGKALDAAVAVQAMLGLVQPRESAT